MKVTVIIDVHACNIHRAEMNMSPIASNGPVRGNKSNIYEFLGNVGEAMNSRGKNFTGSSFRMRKIGGIGTGCRKQCALLSGTCVHSRLAFLPLRQVFQAFHSRNTSAFYRLVIVSPLSIRADRRTAQINLSIRDIRMYFYSLFPPLWSTIEV